MRKSSFGEKNNIFLENILLKMRLNRIIKYFKKIKIKTIADLGCGYYAKSIRKLLDIFPEIEHGIGIDISVNKALNNDKIKLVKSDLNNPLPLADNSLDAAISLAIVEHLDNYDLAINEVYRILKPNGYFFVTTPAPMAKPILEFLAFRLGFLDKDEIGDHKNYFSKNKLCDILRQKNFTIIKSTTFQFDLNNFIVCKK